MMENGTLYSDIPSKTDQGDCCDECGQAFPIKSEDDLSSDNQNEINDSQDEDTSNSPEKKHGCDLCGKKFITSVAVLFHKRTYHGAYSTNNNSSNREFPSATDLEIHARFQVTDNDSEKPINNNSCDSEYPNANEIETLTRVHDRHDDEYPRKCDVCDRELSDAIDLEIHKVYHNTQNNDNSLRCISCNKLFSNATELRMHKTYHDAIGAIDFNAVDPIPSGRTNTTIHEFTTGMDENLTDHNSCDFWGQTNITNPQSCTDENSVQNNCLDKTLATSTNLTGSERPRISKTPVKCSCCNPEPIKRTRLRRKRQRHNKRGCNSRDNALANLTDEEIVNKCLSGENPGQCGICHKTFVAQSYLKVHAGYHKKQRPFPCDSCNKSYVQMQHLNEHKRVHTGEKPYKCNVCDKRFSMKGNVKKHELVHTGLKLYTCDICNSSFTTRFTLERHLIRTHKRTITKMCKVCNQTFNRSCHIAKHLRKHTKQDTDSSLVCTAPTLETTDIHSVAERGQTDNAIAHTDSIQPSAASASQVADIHTLAESRMIDNANKHTETSLNSTTDAETSLSTASTFQVGDLNRPTQSRTTENARTSTESHSSTSQTLQVVAGDRPTESGPTSESLGKCRRSSRRGCNSRKRTDDDQIYNKCLSAKNPAQCGICHKIFSGRHYLRIHAGSHMKERPFPCDICNKSFLQIHHLEDHERIHTGEKPYKCNFCDKRFSMKGNVKKHEVAHTGLKLYSCDICNRAFSLLFSLERHLKRTHKRNITKMCKVCNQTYKKSCHRANHQRQHAGKDNESNLNAVPNPCDAAVEKQTEIRMEDSARAQTETSQLCTTLRVAGTHTLTDSGLTNNTKTYTESNIACSASTPQLSDLHKPTESRIDGVRPQRESSSHALRTPQVANVLHAPTKYKTTDNIREHRESNLHVVPTLPVANAHHRPTECQTELSSNWGNTIETSPTFHVANVLHRPMECRITECQRKKPSSNCNNTVERSPTLHVTDVQWLTEERTTDNRTTAPSNYHRTEALSNSYSENLNTQLHNDQQLIELTSCDPVDNDQLYCELEATEPTGITYICFKCDTEFQLPWQLLEHVDKVHPDKECSN